MTIIIIIITVVITIIIIITVIILFQVNYWWNIFRTKNYNPVANEYKYITSANSGQVNQKIGKSLKLKKDKTMIKLLL